MPLWLLIVLIVLATHRATRLMTRDAIPLIAIPREAFVQRWASYADQPEDQRNVSINGKKTNAFMRSIAYLWECDWCMSIWVTAVITTLAYLWTPLGDQHWLVAILTGLTASTCTGLIAQREPS